MNRPWPTHGGRASELAQQGRRPERGPEHHHAPCGSACSQRHVVMASANWWWRPGRRLWALKGAEVARDFPVRRPEADPVAHPCRPQAPRDARFGFALTQLQSAKSLLAGIILARPHRDHSSFPVSGLSCFARNQCHNIRTECARWSDSFANRAATRCGDAAGATVALAPVLLLYSARLSRACCVAGSSWRRVARRTQGRPRRATKRRRAEVESAVVVATARRGAAIAWSIGPPVAVYVAS